MTPVNDSKRVVIVGGGFCGAMVARELDAHEGTDVTLVDASPNFEYTPGVPRVPFATGVEKKLSVKYESFLSRSRFIEGVAETITPDTVRVEDEVIPFDICVIATGSTQPIQLSNSRCVYTMMWIDDGLEVREKLASAERVLVVGGGVLGTEVAAELATRTPQKEVIMVHGMDRLLERNPWGASEYARRFLAAHDVEMIFEDLVVEHRDNEYVTSGGRRVSADLAIWCAGPRPNPPRMVGFDEQIHTERNALRVNRQLQLRGHPNIFVGGDVTSVREEKTAQNAEHHAETIARNVTCLLGGEPLQDYTLREGPLVISLGGRCGLMTYRRRYVPGMIPGLPKWAIEYCVLAQYR